MSIRYIIGDTETTGLEEDAGVCEIAWIEIDEDLNVVDRVHSLIDPQRPISPSASGVHGITNSMVHDAPTMAEFFEHFQPSIPRSPVGLIAHNLNFDVRFFKPHFGSLDFSLCTLRLARHIWPDAENHKLQTLRYYLADEGLDGGDAHSALGDVETCLSVLRVVRDRFDLSLTDMAELSRKPIVVVKMPFGKHRGLKLDELPSGYVDWLLNKAEIDDDLRYSLELLA